MTQLIVLLCFLGVVFVNLAVAAKNNCKSDKFENCISEMFMVGHETFKFPTSLNQMNSRCK